VKIVFYTPLAPLKGGMLRADADVYSPFEGGKGDVLKNQIQKLRVPSRS